ncbi:hypothetical protein [Peribacillus asahii]|uniref:hypothetical protein n=1 Tax=Peribacillus asahii TaxID=228899 RepID=UPI000FDCA749|nr:hypothetical protein [Peribacillus asahii]
MEYTLYILSDVAENEPTPAHEFKVSYANIKNGEKEQTVKVNTLYTRPTNFDIKDDHYIIDEDYYKFTIKRSSKVSFVLDNPLFFDICQQRIKIPFFQRNKIPDYQRFMTAG